MSDETKTCIACAEKIKTKASLCRYCKTEQPQETGDADYGPSGGTKLKGGQEWDESIHPSVGERVGRGRLISLSALIVLPTLTLLLIDPQLSENGLLEAVGNASLSISGWSIIAAVIAALLLAVSKARQSERFFYTTKVLLVAFSGWLALGLVLFLATVALAGESGATGAAGNLEQDSSGVSGSTSEVQQPATPRETAETPSTATVSACREWQTYWNSTESPSPLEQQAALIRIFLPADELKVVAAANKYYEDVGFVKYLTDYGENDYARVAAETAYLSFVSLWELCNSTYG